VTKCTIPGLNDELYESAGMHSSIQETQRG
jgi:hypothetical protein